MNYNPILLIVDDEATILKTLKEALEFNRQDALAAVDGGYQEERIAL